MLDDWYAIHMLYYNDVPMTHFFNYVNSLLIEKIRSDKRLKSLIRAKCNFYGHTHEIVEHQSHTDYEYEHIAAVFSLNTCDGYTRIGDTIVESVENRIVFFDGSKIHNSTSTSNKKGRFNINLNFL